MAKKIKHRELSREEREEQRVQKAEEKARQAAGIQDDFQAKGFELAQWTQDNQGKVLGAIGLVVLAALVFAGVQWSSSIRSRDASTELSAAVEAYRAPLGDAPGILTGQASDGPSFKDATERATKARELFQAVVDNHGSTGAADLARLYVGHAAFSLEDWAGAIAAYEGYLDSVGKNDSMRFAGLDGLASALEAKGDTAGAIARLEELVALPGKVNEDVALVRTAKLHKAAGDTAKAKAAADRVISDFPESPLKPIAEEIAASTSATKENG